MTSRPPVLLTVHACNASTPRGFTAQYLKCPLTSPYVTPLLALMQLMCLCDRYWAPLDRCRIPGAEAVPLPFTCPMDHVFEPGNLEQRMEGGEPLVPFREYSFLGNPRTPAVVKVGPPGPGVGRGCSWRTWEEEGVCGAQHTFTAWV